MKSLLMVNAAAWAIYAAAAPSVALAQDQQSTTEEANSPEAIIVTATRRAEKLSEVPIAVSVFGGTDIDQTNVRELSEIAGYIPNVEISNRNDFAAVITIRGVGSDSRNIGFDSRVGVYVDGIYMGQSASVNQELLDLERVEVLRGPQGMLFGKNTVAGAISLVTKKPGRDFGATFSADVGNYDYREYKGLVNLPLGDTLAVKGAISKAKRDGYVENIVTGSRLGSRDTVAYRAQLRFTPSSDFEANFAFDGLNGKSLIFSGEPESDSFGLIPVTVAPEPRRLAFDFDPHESRDIYGGLADLEYRFGNGFTLKSITGYRSISADYANDTDYSPLSIFYINYKDQFKQWSEELQLISPATHRLTYMIGLYLHKQTAKTQRDAIFGTDFLEGFVAPAVAPSVAPLLGLDPSNLTEGDLTQIASAVGLGAEGSKVFNVGTVTTKSVAPYVNGSFEITDKLKLGFGARYSVETKDVSWTLDGRNGGVIFGLGSTNPGPSGVPRPLINKRTDRHLSTTLSLSYAFAEDINGYVKYASGYKSGGFNLDYINANELVANSGLEFGKETVNSYEAGLKSDLFDHRLMVNMAAFLANYNGYQVNQFIDLGGGRTSIRITNAAKVKTKGIELEFSLKASDSLAFQGSVGLLDAKYDSFPAGGAGGADASGKRLTSAPKFSGSIGMTYTRRIPAIDSTLSIRADLNHTSSQFTTVDNVSAATLQLGAQVPYGQIGASDQINARIALKLPGDNFEVAVWGHNLTNEQDPVDSSRDFFGTVINHPQIGRTYGASLTVKF